MISQNERPYHPYSWHQSHDQATVLLMVPYNTQEDELSVVIEHTYLIVGVRGESPTIKGRLYGPVDVNNSVWQLEPRGTRLSTRERTTSTTSTASTHSSYAFVSDPDISSSFAASLDSNPVSDVEDTFAPSPAFSSPRIGPAEERYPLGARRTSSKTAASRSVSPGQAIRSMTSSYSSLESLHVPGTGRLLTLHLEKEFSVIWPSLVVGPVPHSLSPVIANSVVFDASHEMEHQYNMDPTSLALIALELFDIRHEKEEAFECFLRAWHQARVPSATMRLVSHYLPLQKTYDVEEPDPNPPRGTHAYYFRCLGGSNGLAQLYLEAGLLHLEGAASTLLASSYSSLASIRMPLQSQVGEGGTVAWKRDREAAGNYFERARILQPQLDIPSLPSETETHRSGDNEELEMPSMDLGASAPASNFSGDSPPDPDAQTIRRRRKKEELALLDNRRELEELDNTWYFYIPGLVGAGTALLVVGIVGALSFSNWSRRNQGS